MRVTLQRSSEEVEQLRAWYEVRDTLLGQNGVTQDVKESA
jgi:hypothetical protein